MPAPRVACRWLVSARYDLTFFVLSCLVTWVFLGIYLGLGSLGVDLDARGILITYFLFTAVFDHPHIFQTFSRTHADRVEYKRHRGTHTFGLALFVLTGFLLSAKGYESQLIVFAALFGTWHIVRQHWGFLRVYKARNDDFEPVDNWLDGLTFYSGMVAFVLYDYTGNPPDTVIYGKLIAHFPNAPEWLGEAAWYFFLVCLVLFVGRQLHRLATGRPINVPKLLLMAAAMGTHGLVFFFTATPFLIAEALETAYHNVQYQGWVMHYQRRRFGAHVVRKWLGVALLYGLIVGAIEIAGLLDRTWSWLFTPFAMAVLYHYWVDGKIWRMRQAPELRHAMLHGPS